MKVLFVAAENPFARDSGANLRLRPFVEAVARKGECHLLKLGPRSARPIPAAPFASSETAKLRPSSAPARLLRTILTGEPDITFRTRSTRLATTLHRRLVREKFDVVHLAGLQLAYLVQPFCDTFGVATDKSAPRPLLLLDELNAEYVVHQRLAATDSGQVTPWRRTYSLIQWALLKRYERRILSMCDIVTCPGEADLESLRDLAPEANLRVIASGVDLDALERVPPPPPDPVALFIGDLNYRPNQQAAEWLLDRVAPAVWERVPDARFVFVGAGDRPEAHDVGGRVSFAGYVNDVEPYLRAARVVVAPLLSGGGIKLKVLEGMAAGRAVVTTPVGAEGIAEPGEQSLLIAEGVDAFAEAIMDVLNDDGLAVGLGLRAREFIRGRFGRPEIGERYLEVIGAAMDGVAGG